MSNSNCCFLTCIQISQEADQVVWYSHLSQNFPQFIVIYTVKGFGIVNKAEVDVFLEVSHFFDDSTHVGNLISGSSFFSFFKYKFIHFNWRLITLQLYWFCHTSTWICHKYTCVPHPEAPSLLLSFLIQLEHLKVHGSCIAEACVGGFWALLYWHVRWVQLCGSLDCLYILLWREGKVER